MKKVGFAARLLVLAAVLSLAAFAVAGCGKDKADNASGGGGTGSTADLSGAQPVESSKSVETTVDEGDLDAEKKAVLSQIVGFANATEKKDYEAICDDYLSKESQKLRANGADKNATCADYFSQTGKSIKTFKIYVTGIDINKDGTFATVAATTTVNGQKQPVSNIAMKKEGGKWKVSVLGQ